MRAYYTVQWNARIAASSYEEAAAKAREIIARGAPKFEVLPPGTERWREVWMGRPRSIFQRIGDAYRRWRDSQAQQ